MGFTSLSISFRPKVRWRSGLGWDGEGRIWGGGDPQCKHSRERKWVVHHQQHGDQVWMGRTAALHSHTQTDCVEIQYPIHLLRNGHLKEKTSEISQVGVDFMRCAWYVKKIEGNKQNKQKKAMRVGLVAQWAKLSLWEGWKCYYIDQVFETGAWLFRLVF